MSVPRRFYLLVCPRSRRVNIFFFFLLGDLQVATGQVASTGMVAMSYVQKVSEKVR